MKTLENIWTKIQAGDKVLMQKTVGKNDFTKPELIIIVSLDVWDMAMAVYYTKYKDFNNFNDRDNEPKIYSFGEWMEYWHILGHWKAMPNFNNLIKAYRKQIISDKIEPTE